MYIRLDPHSGEPLVKQLKDRIKILVASGAVKPGAQIDSVRGLAEKTGVNPTTIQSAFAQLEHDGYLVMRQGRGAFAATKPPPFTAGEKKRQVAALLRAALVEAVFLGLSRDQVFSLINDELTSLTGGTDHE